MVACQIIGIRLNSKTDLLQNHESNSPRRQPTMTQHDERKPLSHVQSGRQVRPLVFPRQSWIHIHQIALCHRSGEGKFLVIYILRVIIM